MAVFENKNFKRVDTCEELETLLKRYEGILSLEMRDYLNSLIGLEFSVMRDYISEEKREVLAELDIYKRIAIYNIYNRAYQILTQGPLEFKICGNQNDFEQLFAFYRLSNGEGISVFKFDYSVDPKMAHQFRESSYKTMDIGTISLFQVLENEKFRKQELARMKRKLNRLYNEICYRDELAFDKVWNYEQDRKIKECSKEIERLSNIQELSAMDRAKIEVTNHVQDLMLEDYGMKDMDFEVQKQDSYLKKRLVKRAPNVTIQKDIQYL